MLRRIDLGMWPMAWCLTIAAFASLAGSAAGPRRDLGGAPLCEASAVVRVPCPAREDADCLLVGDNEIRDRLFLFETEADGSPRVASRRAIEIGHLLGADRQLSDLEALARLSDGELLAYGSHSRNKDCKIRRKRRRFLGLRLRQTGQGVVAVAGRVPLTSAGAGLDWRDPFGPQPSGTLARLQAAVLAADAAADAGDCRQAFDLEAAVVVPRRTGDEVWLGLRAPLVGDDAVLVRHERSASALRFVEARRVATGGTGIRALTRASSPNGGWLYGLSPAAGGEEDREFRLWRFQEAQLASGDASRAIPIESVSFVASRSEGVAVVRRGAATVAIVVQDGKQGATPSTCDTNASYQLLRLPEDGGGSLRRSNRESGATAAQLFGSGPR